MTMIDGDDDREWEELVMNGRMCIVSRRPLPAERLLRFVADPAGRVVPDLKRRLPGRGAHVGTARVGHLTIASGQVDGASFEDRAHEQRQHFQVQRVFEDGVRETRFL